MKNLFSLDSPVMQLLSKLLDMILLNLLFLLSCVPVVTIGAAQAGLMTAVRALKSEDESCFRAYFRGFLSGFWRITLIWSLGLAILATQLTILVASVYLDASIDSFSALCAVISLVLFAMFLSMATAFHSRFGCSVWQIIRSSWFLSLTNPVRTLLMAVLIWMPVAALLYNFTVFIKLIPLWGLIYYAAVYTACANLVKKPFLKLEKQFFPNESAGEETINESSVFERSHNEKG